ncbi:hypothetical protein CICLE_v10024077mg, partial [Citrus x clementina]
ARLELYQTFVSFYSLSFQVSRSISFSSDDFLETSPISVLRVLCLLDSLRGWIAISIGKLTNLCCT